MERIKKLGNKGYMLIEIILASTIAFGLAYYMLDLTLKLKNKNDDLLVETLTATDSAIISNGIMRYIKKAEKENKLNNIFKSDCKNIISYDDKRESSSFRELKINGELIDIINEYAYVDVSEIRCSNDDEKIYILVPIGIKQLNKFYDVDLYYRIGG